MQSTLYSCFATINHATLCIYMYVYMYVCMCVGIYKDFDRTITLCETLVSAGASALTIHGRTREEAAPQSHDNHPNLHQ